MLISITACGNNDSNEKGDNNTAEEKEGNTEEKNEPVVLSDALDEYPIWYQVEFSSSAEELTRDSSIEGFYIFKDNKVNGYSLPDIQPRFKIDDIVDMSDSEALDKIIEDKKESIEDEKNKNNESNDFLAKLEEDNNTVKSMNTAEEYTLELKYDDKGQYIEGEEIINPDKSSTKSKNFYPGYITDDVFFATEIFDESFVGFDTNYDEAFVTRVEDNSIEITIDDENNEKE